MLDKIKHLPKIELHCHLDGSVDIFTLKNLADKAKKDLTTEQIIKEVIAPKPCQNLTEYLRCFPLTTSLLQSEKEMILAVLSIAKQAVEENVKYIELRFSPEFISHANFSMEQVVNSAIIGKDYAETIYDIKIGLILCLMRGRNDETNFEVIELAKKYYPKISALDLAGDETKYPMPLYKEMFERISFYNIPFTIHAGETGSLENIKEAISFGAKRIGHGIALAKDLNFADEIIKNNITLEMCPSCNIQTRASSAWEVYPLKTFFDKGVAITINTDNRTVSDTTLTNEFIAIDSHIMPLTLKDYKTLTMNALNAAFLNDLEKNKIEQKIITDLSNFE